VPREKEIYDTRCHDTGSESCPCFLADAGQCIACPVLRGEQDCDACAWGGVCVYDSYSRGDQAHTRRYIRAPIKSEKSTAAGLHCVTVHTPRHWSAELRQPGSFLMVKPPGSEETWACPMAVFSVASSGELSTIVYRERGPKTQQLARHLKTWEVAGPYRSGLLGVRRLNRAVDCDALILTSGTGQSLLPNILRRLNDNNCSVQIALDPGMDGAAYVVQALPEFAGSLSLIRLDAEIAGCRQESTAGIISSSSAPLVISLGSDHLHIKVGAALQRDRLWVASNNRIMVCAAGWCGACTVIRRDGSELRGCRADIAPEDVFWSGDWKGERDSR